MGSKPRSLSMPRRRSHSHRRVSKLHKGSRIIVNGGAASVSDKLEALKNLIPAHIDGEVKADELFQETADYIVLLRTQILVLQKLINIHGSNSSGLPQNNQNAV